MTLAPAAGVVDENDLRRCAVGALKKSSDFQRVLAIRPRRQSAHFAVHHLESRPAEREKARLSTDLESPRAAPVDDLSSRWAGWVVPKRHARRAVTRSLVKRQLREALYRHADGLPAGMWVLRLRSALSRSAYPSAASKPLRFEMRNELDALLLEVVAHAKPR